MLIQLLILFVPNNKKKYFAKFHWPGICCFSIEMHLIFGFPFFIFLPLNTLNFWDFLPLFLQLFFCLFALLSFLDSNYTYNKLFYCPTGLWGSVHFYLFNFSLYTVMFIDSFFSPFQSVEFVSEFFHFTYCTFQLCIFYQILFCFYFHVWLRSYF